MTAPSILLIDDGELDGVQTLLERLCTDWVRCAEPGSAIELPRPRDLIISSGPRAMAMPPLVGDTTPIWICIYGDDFLPLREPLIALGVHYLVSQNLDPHALELFVRQLMVREGERRRVRRIPVRQEVSIEAGVDTCKGLLLELSADSCVFACDAAIPSERRVRLRMPIQTLTGREVIDLSGSVLRSCRAVRNGGEPHHVHVFRFGSLDVESMCALQQTLSGDTLDADVTPLDSEPERDAPAADQELDGALEIELVRDVAPASEPRRAERRSRARSPYRGTVSAIRWEGEAEPSAVLGRDVSMSGMRIATTPAPGIGTEVALALYGGGREEPVLVSGEVVRVDGDGCALRFTGLGPVERKGLAAFIEGKPRLERLVGHREALCVATIVEG